MQNKEKYDFNKCKIAYNHAKERYEIKYLVPESYDQGEILLPSFAIGTMYKGMEVGHKYTVEELGL